MRLREVLKIQGLSQMELARRTGMHSSTVSLLVSGRMIPSEVQKQRISEALDMGIGEIWSEFQGMEG